MQTKDHYLLGKYLLNNSSEIKVSTMNKEIYRKAFLIGCVEPDYNLISYLRGTLSKKMFAGHNYENAYEYMISIQERLCKTTNWGVREYFMLGRYIHYVCDSFTYAHNEVFEGTLKQHCDYEEELHTEFMQYMKLRKKNEGKISGMRDRIKLLASKVDRLHEEYLSRCGRPIIDCRYILLAAECL